MEQEFSLDTSILIDIHEKRGYNGEVATKLLKKIIKEEHRIIFSNFVIIELKKLGYSKNEINQIYRLIEPLNKKMVHVTKEQFLEARKIAKKRKLPLADVIHAIIARDNQAYMVTRDREFSKIKDITKSYLPEDFL